MSVEAKKLNVAPRGTSEFCYGLPGAIEPLGPFDPLGFTKGADVLEVNRLREVSDCALNVRIHALQEAPLHSPHTAASTH